MMSANEWAGLAVATTTLVGAFSFAVKHLVKHYLSELKPDKNGGHNLEGRLVRVEARVDEIYKLLLKRL